MITDDQMRAGIAQSRNYALVILSDGPNRNAIGANDVIWEHGRRNFELRAEGKLAVVCPVTDAQTAYAGVGVFATSVAEARSIMAGDPAVQAGILSVEVVACRGFPGDHLPS